MGFQLTQSPTFRQSVEMYLRGEDGKVVEIKFTGIFKRREQDEIDAFVDQGMGDESITRENLVGWEDGPVGEDKAPLPFDMGNLSLFLKKIHGARTAVSRAFFEGNNASVRKN